MSKMLREAVVERAVQLMEAGWCRDALARDAAGNKVDVYCETAAAFCIIGAMMRATREVVGETETRTATDILCAVIRNFSRLAADNERGTHAEAIAALRKFGEELSSRSA